MVQSGGEVCCTVTVEDVNASRPTISLDLHVVAGEGSDNLAEGD